MRLPISRRMRARRPVTLISQPGSLFLSLSRMRNGPWIDFSCGDQWRQKKKEKENERKEGDEDEEEENGKEGKETRSNRSRCNSGAWIERSESGERKREEWLEDSTRDVYGLLLCQTSLKRFFKPVRGNVRSCDVIRGAWYFCNSLSDAVRSSFSL